MSRFFKAMIVSGCAFLLVTSSVATAAIIPFGVQKNVSVNTVLNTWGWSIAYQGDYNVDSVALSTVFAGVSTGDYVMYAAKQKNSNEFALLAAGLESDVRTYTAFNQTTLSNGVAWYFNGGSMGFAAGNQSISQNEADVMDSGFGPNDPNNADGSTRLSWHTSAGGGVIGEYGVSPTHLRYGWRAGDTAFLNNSSDWERFVLVARANNAIPEPGSLLVWGVLGLAGMGMTNRRRKG
jgi:hypothetical protein